jgi:hypothetical protein
MMSEKLEIEWDRLDFAGFAKLANDARLSKYEKIGFPDSYRKGFEAAIFADVQSKLPTLGKPKRTVLDIGPGCSDLPQMLIDLCRRQQNELHLVDSAEMLAQLPDDAFVSKHPGEFPGCGSDIAYLRGQVHVILCYSVLHYVLQKASVVDFIDLSLLLLAPRGEMLIGDIPNISKRKRFFTSEAGIAFHRAFTGHDAVPDVEDVGSFRNVIDDSVVMALLSRARAAGADAYVVPQPPRLPMANRREDILIQKP